MINLKDKAVSQPSSLILIVLNWIPFHKKNSYYAAPELG